MVSKKNKGKKSKKEEQSTKKDVEEPIEAVPEEVNKPEDQENEKDATGEQQLEVKTASEGKEKKALLKTKEQPSGDQKDQKDQEEAKDAVPQLSYVKPSKSLKNLDKGHAQERKASGIYSQLSQDQINVLRDAFSLIDGDNDGIISDEDLVKAYKLINKDVPVEQRSKMFSEVQDPLAFGGFLSSLAGKLGELSNKDELEAAFEIFSTDNRSYVQSQNIDKKDELKCNVKELKESLLSAGMSEEEIELALKSFTKTEMNGTDIFLAERFINTVRDD